MRVLIVRNNYNTKAIEAALVLEAFLASQGIEYAVYDTDDLRSSTEIAKQEKVSDIDSFDLAVVLGGRWNHSKDGGANQVSSHSNIRNQLREFGIYGEFKC